MSRNLELKAHLSSAVTAIEVAAALTESTGERLDQTDTYFQVKFGRLKLRESPQLHDELIYYLRPHESPAKICRYWRQPTQAATELRRLLKDACGIDCIVRKHRELFWYRGVRIHIDQVEGLGDFLELEAILEEDTDGGRRSGEDQALDTVAHLIESLSIIDDDLIAESYRELVQEVATENA